MILASAGALVFLIAISAGFLPFRSGDKESKSKDTEVAKSRDEPANSVKAESVSPPRSAIKEKTEEQDLAMATTGNNTDNHPVESSDSQKPDPIVEDPETMIPERQELAFPEVAVNVRFMSQLYC